MKSRYLLFCAASLLSVKISTAQNLPSIVDIAQAYADGRYAQVAGDCSLRIEADSTDDAAFYYLGLAEYRSGNPDKAKSCIGSATALSPDNASYLEAALDIAYTEQDQESIETLCGKLVRMSPQKYRTPYTLTLLGEAELHKLRDTSALEYFREALELDENFASARLDIADVYFARGNYPAFFVEMTEIARSPYLEPEGVCDCINEIFKKIDNRFFQVWNKQLDLLATAPLEVNPSDTSCLNLAGWWFYRSSRPEKALGYFETMDSLYPYDFCARRPLLEFHLIAGNTEKVLSQCSSMLSDCVLDNRDKAMLLSTSGDCFYLLGKKQKAFRLYEQAVSICPDDRTLLNNYAYYLCEEGRRLKKAEEMSRKALEADPDSPTLLDTYGWILYKLHRPADAKPYFKRAIIYGGKESRAVLEHYSKVLEALGEKELSVYYKNLAEKKPK